jgi:hypothetical protein
MTMWYYQLNDQQEGPCDGETIKDLIERRTIGRATLVWKEGLHAWCRLAETELVALLPPVILAGITKPGDVRKTWLIFAILASFPWAAAILALGLLALEADNVSGTENGFLRLMCPKSVPDTFSTAFQYALRSYRSASS